MGVPKKRKSHSRVRMRRSHDALKRKTPGECPRCGTLRMPHTICTNCGTYATRGKERQVLDMEAED